MKKYLSIVLFLTVLLTVNSSKALVGGPNLTNTDISLPGEIVSGSTIVVNTTTTYQGGVVPSMGEVTFLNIQRDDTRTSNRWYNHTSNCSSY